jgi:lipoprotein-anchoring transpeptidase ErfK/SrfK
MGNEKIIVEDTLPEKDVNTKGTGSIDNNNTGSGEKTSGKFKSGVFTIFRVILIFICSVIFTLALFLFVIYVVPDMREHSPIKNLESSDNKALKNDQDYKKQMGLLNKDAQRLTLKVNAYTSGQSYIVINTTENRFLLYTNKKLIREGFCSSGSYTMLQTSGNKKWVFKTPKGKYWVRGKTTNPVWKRPDWSFVEEGSPIPSANDQSRYEYGVLGDYALALGDGYMIHGTIYKRFLGMPVTHGCVRLNDDDLKIVFNTLNIGSKVYIF